MTLTARPTTYRGIQMRSRLEARFAAWLDDPERGFRWVYEPNAFADHRGQYLPDFRVDAFQWPLYIEVKPTAELGYEARERMEIIWASEPTAELLVCVPEHDLTFVARAGGAWKAIRFGDWP